MVFIPLTSENAANHQFSPESWLINILPPSLDSDIVLREEEPWNWDELDFFLAQSTSSCDIGQFTQTLCALIYLSPA